MSSTETDEQNNEQRHNGEDNTKSVEYLLTVIVENRERRCKEIRDSAHAEAKKLLKQTYADARGRVHERFYNLREKFTERVSAAQARNQTLIRQHHHQADKEILQTAWPMLGEALLARWADSESRSKWIDAAIHNALSIFLKQCWRVEHPADFSKKEQDSLRQRFKALHGEIPELGANAGIEAGIRIFVDETVLDATIDGLLQQKSTIESQLIAGIKRGGQL